MCGICGVITTNNNKKVIHTVKALLLANESRGGDSTGICINKTIFKKAVPATHFIEKLNDADLVKNKQASILGHTRLATTGAINEKNAHPFAFGDIVGVHNGVLSDWRTIYDKAEVDSEAIFYLLDKEHNDFVKVFPQLSGSIGAAWEHKGITYLVSHNNPVSLAYLDKSIYFSSEAEHLACVLYGVHKKLPPIQTLEQDIVYAVSPDLTITKTPVKFKAYAYKPYSYYYEEYQDEKKHWWDSFTQPKTEAKEPNEQYETFKYEYYDGQGAKIVFEDLMELEGCSICGAHTAEGYLDRTYYEVYCSVCRESIEDKELIMSLEYIPL